MDKNSIEKTSFRKGARQLIAVAPFILIGFVFVCIFVIYPQIKNVWMSLTEYNIMQPSNSVFVGIQNYAKAFVGDEKDKFWIAFRNVILYGVFTIPPGMLIGLILAVLINGVKKFNTFFRAILYLPVLIDWIVVSIIFLYLFSDGKAGLVNYYLMKLNILQQPIAWFSSTWTANAVIWIFGIWKSIGWVMIIYLAGLQGISKDIYEAAEIDGATKTQKFLKITIPLIRPTTYFVLINLIIGSFNVFFAVYMLTSGGPIGTTDVLQNYMYNQAFKYMNFGYACAISVITGLSILLLTIFRDKFFKYERN
ncbi:Lactose transport system permease protein LacF [Caprobacter fermentans]|uniref:Lactose transport system permease protein LacF n=1 Tax=Caproicibacter fermentans TaxID=2576756 RepID=A0A6N8I300_9FIRM|nr:sugar ABC transporter permease [Caproicibacter fermentans]MVB12464.1 Lactose transport system permease protein LacF [Caproicibacter fermentans]